MISQSARLVLLIGLMIFAVAPGTSIAPGSTVTSHHQPVMCGPGPDC